MSDLAETDILFTRHDDGRVTVNCFPPTIEVTEKFLRDMAGAGATSLARLQGDRLILAVANGEATYLVEEADPIRNVRRCVRLHATGAAPIT